MNNIGMISSYSAYAENSTYKTSAISAYNSTQAISNQGISDAQNSLTKTSPTDEIKDEAIISDEANNLLANDKSNAPEPKKDSTNKYGEKLTPEQEQVVAKLKARDAEVRAHEQAHISAAAGISASAPTYEYQTGPDGKQYAIGGEVTVSFVEGKDPKENIANAEAMLASALAPSQPSSQDMAVASSAEKIIADAKQELAEKEAQESKSEETEDSSSSSDGKNIKPNELSKNQLNPDKLPVLTSA